MRIPAGMEWRRAAPGGSEWLERLPGLAAACAEAWSLTLGEPYPGSNLSLVVPAAAADGSPAALKLAFPGDGPLREADALAHWDGRGAVRLLARDEAQHALLLERCEPGSYLAALRDGDEVLRVAADLLPRLWIAPPPGSRFPSLADALAPWTEELAVQWHGLGRPFERRLVDEARRTVDELAPPGRDAVALHGDFHSGNVLSARREPWLAIDPIPIAGDAAFDAASLLRDRRWVVTERTLRRRVDVLAERLGLDRERVRRWGLVQALFWGVSRAKLEPDMIECARLLAA